MKRVYFDCNATTAVEPQVLEAMLPYLSGEFGNASSIHGFGQRARGAVETAREQVAGQIGARAQEIVFTSGGTEADNHAIFGVVRAAITDRADVGGQAGSKEIEAQNPNRLQSAKAPHIVTTAIEHEAVLNACQALEKEGVGVTYVDVDRGGRVEPEAIRRALRAETVLITVMHANNELGTVQPLGELGAIAAEADVYFHTDAVQSAGKMPIDVGAMKIDLLSISGHKIYGPKGVGALYVRGGARVQQLMYGGHHQRGFRPGTENV
ncbi:MAG TPA: cysteine desulfurase family protein, partial [Candidatus Eremiobacteraceae bacterium]|nr:cysteine desulfurase family protein [Candidatus Eremiobacteraceae bacterium]